MRSKTNAFTAGIEAALLAQRPDQDLEAFAERVVAEVVEAGSRDRGGQQVAR